MERKWTCAFAGFLTLSSPGARYAPEKQWAAKPPVVLRRKRN
jgi:hypothetical protein